MNTETRRFSRSEFPLLEYAIRVRGKQIAGLADFVPSGASRLSLTQVQAGAFGHTLIASYKAWPENSRQKLSRQALAGAFGHTLIASYKAWPENSRQKLSCLAIWAGSTRSELAHL